jgi:hypothetical protein
MFTRLLAATVLAAVVCLPLVVSAAAPPVDLGALEIYSLPATPELLEQLQREGFDVLEVHEPGSPMIHVVMSPAERLRLQAEGLRPVLWRSPSGKTSTELAAEQQQGGYNVYRSWDEEGGIKDELVQLARDHPNIVKLEVLGTSIQDREIIALKVTKDAQTTPDGTRPAVLFSALQHAREWIAIEVDRRLLHYFVENYGTDELITRLVDTQEIWFVPCMNPDGYQNTFEPNRRLWRKNMRDNNADGQIANGDGVDPNRNYPGHWGYDNEGSSPNFGSETYRGAGPASEPETQAILDLLERVEFTFQVNYHSVASLILYPVGWQMKTHAADHPILSALAGDVDNPAIPGFRPQVSADLYITNGEMCGTSYDVYGVLCYTPELSDQGSNGGFVFPDDEALVQKEFMENLPFALDIAQSTADPTRLTSHLGNSVVPMYPDVFTVSYGDPQVVQVNAMRRLGPVTLKFQVNGGTTVSAPTTEWEGGERYGSTDDVYYHRVRGQVQGAMPGDQVRVWFEAQEEAELIRTEPFTYGLAVDSNATVLVVADEDYTGTAPVYAKTDGPSSAQAYLDALAAIGLAADLYDVDAHGREAPSPRGVLSHYRLVVWTTGDDILTRASEAETISRLPLDMQLAVRDFLNEGGKLLVAGSHTGFQTAMGALYHAVTAKPCSLTDNTQRQGCENFYNDFMQYYLGASGFSMQLGKRGPRELYPVAGSPRAAVNDLPGILDGLNLSFSPLQASSQVTMTGYVPYMVMPSYGMVYNPISNALPAAQFPQFRSRTIAGFDRPGLSPHSGAGYLRVTSAGGSTSTYRRLTRTINLTDTTSASLTFWASHVDWPDWGNLFVEAHTPGQDDWTTLADLNGHSRHEPNTACGLYPTLWPNRHPHLLHYLSYDDTVSPPVCQPQGTSGQWNAASGSSDGWQEWRVDLSAWSGKQVEVSLSALTGYAAVGAYIDDVAIQGDNVSVVTGTLATSFDEGRLDGWRVAGPPPGSPNSGGGISVVTPDQPQGVPQGGPAILTEDSVLLTFGLEHVAGTAGRQAVLQRVVDYLLPRPTIYLPATYRQHDRP